MKIRIERLLQFRLQFLLQIFFVGVVVAFFVAQQSFGVERSAVQWRSGANDGVINVHSSTMLVSHDLRWRKPETNNSVNRNSQRIIRLPETETETESTQEAETSTELSTGSESPIILVQHVESILPPPAKKIQSTTATPILPGMPSPKPVDSYEQDRFNRGIPQQKSNPPAGSTNTPSTQNSSTDFSTGKKVDDAAKSNQNKNSTNATRTLADTPAVKSTGKTKNENGQNKTAKNNSDALTNPSNNTSDLPFGFSNDSLPQSFNLTSADKVAAAHDCKIIGFKPINEISCDIKPRPGVLPEECPLTYEPYTGRHFRQTCFQWKASALCTKGAYFENVQLDRYGHSVCPLLEPVISGAKFFTTIPLLPYKAGLTPPNECVYTLGHYRVGNCAPHALDPLPISVRAILFEGAAIAGAIAIIP
ncbi:MAG: hypothetical protein LBP59_04410 [Planctomycetaceae bacterium]|jgi:hypothetical protein|nr:hypothetical protein [Planctomycetaceae bacterium]